MGDPRAHGGHQSPVSDLGMLWKGGVRAWGRGQGWTSKRKGQSALRVHTERRLQGVPRLGAPAGGMDVWVVSIDPEVIGMTPAVEVELGRKGPWWSGISRGAQLSRKVLQAPGGSPHPWGLSEARFWIGRTKAPTPQ